MNELKNREGTDILRASVDSLTGFPDAIPSVFPKTEIQVCMRTKVPVQRVRTSVWFIPYKEREGGTCGFENDIAFTVSGIGLRCPGGVRRGLGYQLPDDCTVLTEPVG
ncbi:hypothetical protein Holit_03047 [Hollandina sp. SP2]